MLEDSFKEGRGTRRGTAARLRGTQTGFLNIRALEMCTRTLCAGLGHNSSRVVGASI